MSSGVKCLPDVIDRFNELKLRHCFRYIMMGLINKETEIGVLKCAPVGSTYEEFLEELREAACKGEGRYAVYDVQYNDGTQNKTKLVFICWVPNSIGVRQKMLYASSKAEIKKKLVGVGKELQATDMDEIAEDVIVELAKKGDHGCA